LRPTRHQSEKHGTLHRLSTPFPEYINAFSSGNSLPIFTTKTPRHEAKEALVFFVSSCLGGFLLSPLRLQDTKKKNPRAPWCLRVFVVLLLHHQDSKAQRAKSLGFLGGFVPWWFSSFTTQRGSGEARGRSPTGGCEAGPIRLSASLSRLI
jgi:hypothetical protein